MSKKKNKFVIMILIFVILAGAGQLVTVQAKEEDHEIVVWYRPTASSSER